jgi:hypothetical protein
MEKNRKKMVENEVLAAGRRSGRSDNLEAAESNRTSFQPRIDTDAHGFDGEGKQMG